MNKMCSVLDHVKFKCAGYSTMRHAKWVRVKRGTDESVNSGRTDGRTDGRMRG